MFPHKDDLVFNELKTENINGKRHYVIPNGEKYPSVTTVTGIAARAGIKAWREKVGEAEANKIASMAARRGTKVHKLCEDYLNNIELDYGAIEPINHFLFVFVCASTPQFYFFSGSPTSDTKFFVFVFAFYKFAYLFARGFYTH